jgi:hypothetical protein
MSRSITVHLVAGILFVGVGTPDAQESNPRPAVVEVRDTPTDEAVFPTKSDSSTPKNDVLEPSVAFRLTCVTGIEGELGVMVAIAPHNHLNDPNDDIEARQNAAASAQDASDSPQANAGTLRRWLTGAMTKLLELVIRGVVETSRK